MQLEKLSLLNFRNYPKKSFKFRGNTTLFVGGNGVGKTNILEAVFLLATGGSFRAKRIDEMVSFNEEFARVEGVVGSEVSLQSGSSQLARNELDDAADLKSVSAASSSERVGLQVLLTRGEFQGKRVAKRKFSVDGASKRVGDFVGRLVVVLFRPEDLRIILGSPSRRRRFFDEVLNQVNRDYRRSLVSYENALRRRNRILDAIRDKGVSRTQLAFWDQLIIKHGQILTSKREELVEFINHAKIDVDSFELFYERSTVTEARLFKYSGKEVAAGYTLVGPHKDDFVIRGSISGKGRGNRDLSAYGSRGEPRKNRDLAIYGSRGEQRLAILWLKLCELNFVSEKIGERPLLVLDDIFSELDHKHRDVVLKLLGKQQTILTTADLHLVESRYKKEMQIIELS